MSKLVDWSLIDIKLKKQLLQLSKSNLIKACKYKNVVYKAGNKAATIDNLIKAKNKISKSKKKKKIKKKQKKKQKNKKKIKKNVAICQKAHWKIEHKQQCKKLANMSLNDVSNSFAIDPTSSTIQSIFKVYAAIDFGTDGTGLAYSLPQNDQVYIHDKWRRLDNNSTFYDKLKTYKPKTAILLGADKSFKTFGDAALQTYMILKDTSLLLFEHFKMHLYKKPHYGDQNNINDDDKKNDNNDEKGIMKETLTAVNGNSCPTSVVFIEALKHLKKQAMGVFRRNKLHVKSVKDVCWILTVPAIWDESAKAKMKQWAYAAGMIDKDIDNHLLLQYEPDCASLSIQHEFNTRNINKQLPPKFRNNVKYILIDAGGGTVDIACHKFVGNNSVKELMHPSGGPWGDMYVEHRFLDIIDNMFSKEWVEEFKKEAPNEYVKLLDNFRRAKYNFTGQSKSEWHYVTLPFAFVEFLEFKFQDDGIEDYVNEYIHNDETNVFNLDGDQFKMHFKIWKTYLFDPFIDATINHCKTLLSHTNMVNTRYLCLVGGFSGIKYFQTRIKKAFGKKSTYKLSIIIPERPILSVLDGAARMARLAVANRNNINIQNNRIVLQPFIKSRRMPHTYAVRCSGLLSDFKDKLSADYIKNNSYTDYKNIQRVRNIFHVFCNINQEIEYGKKVTYEFVRPGPYVNGCVIAVYTTQTKNPLTLDKKCIKLVPGEIPIEFDVDDDDDESISVEFHFYGTQIVIYGYRSRNNSKGEPLKLECNKK